jgi:hypothetical protein
MEGDHLGDPDVDGRIILGWIFRKWEGVVGKPERKRQLGRTRRRWKDNIKMDLQEVGRGCGETREKETIEIGRASCRERVSKLV